MNEFLDLELLKEQAKERELREKEDLKREEMRVEMYGMPDYKLKRYIQAKQIDGIEIAYRAIKKCELELKRLFNK